MPNTKSIRLWSENEILFNNLHFPIRAAKWKGANLVLLTVVDSGFIIQIEDLLFGSSQIL